jgi:hypothetical protein
MLSGILSLIVNAVVVGFGLSTLPAEEEEEEEEVEAEPEPETTKESLKEMEDEEERLRQEKQRIEGKQKINLLETIFLASFDLLIFFFFFFLCLENALRAYKLQQIALRRAAKLRQLAYERKMERRERDRILRQLHLHHRRHGHSTRERADSLTKPSGSPHGSIDETVMYGTLSSSLPNRTILQSRRPQEPIDHRIRRRRRKHSRNEKDYTQIPTVTTNVDKRPNERSTQPDRLDTLYRRRLHPVDADIHSRRGLSGRYALGAEAEIVSRLQYISIQHILF